MVTEAPDRPTQEVTRLCSWCGREKDLEGRPIGEVVRVGLDLVLFLQKANSDNDRITHGVCVECKPRINARHPAVTLDSLIAQKHMEWVQKRIQIAKLQESVDTLALDLSTLNTQRQIFFAREGV
jgi:hypothetical protein